MSFEIFKTLALSDSGKCHPTWENEPRNGRYSETEKKHGNERPVFRGDNQLWVRSSLNPKEGARSSARIVCLLHPLYHAASNLAQAPKKITHQRHHSYLADPRSEFTRGLTKRVLGGEHAIPAVLPIVRRGLFWVNPLSEAVVSSFLSPQMVFRTMLRLWASAYSS